MYDSIKSRERSPSGDRCISKSHPNAVAAKNEWFSIQCILLNSSNNTVDLIQRKLAKIASVVTLRLSHVFFQQTCQDGAFLVEYRYKVVQNSRSKRWIQSFPLIFPEMCWFKKKYRYWDNFAAQTDYVYSLLGALIIVRETRRNEYCMDLSRQFCEFRITWSCSGSKMATCGKGPMYMHTGEGKLPKYLRVLAIFPGSEICELFADFLIWNTTKNII